MYSSLVSHSIYSPTLPTPTSSDSAFTMPSLQDWKISPWVFMDKMLQSKDVSQNTSQEEIFAAVDNWETEVDEFFQEKLRDPQTVRNLPSLNVVETHDLVDGQLVRFRCMIQDMFDPEYYFGSFEIKDLSTGKIRIGSGKFRDVAPCGSREEINTASSVTRHKDRQTLYCVTIPGEAPWVLDVFKQMEGEKAYPSCSKRENRLKRSIDEESASENAGQGAEPMDAETNEDVVNANNSDVKKAKLENGEINTGQANASKSTRLDLNLPIPNSKGKACIVKVYGPDTSFSVNHCYEFVGIISLDPALAALSNELGDQEEMMHVWHQQEQLTRSPPPSLIPRLHVIHYRKIQHSNPYLDQSLPKEIPSNEAETCRAELHAILTNALMGDTLAADYLICHLISKIYSRHDVLTVGKFSLNLHNMSLHENYAKRLATILQLLLSKSHYLPMTVENFNKLSFIPKKDYHANRLVSGLLQLSEDTHLILDETTMSDGQLNPEGVKNLTALASMIKWQKVEYDFNYHKLEFASDVPCLILSEGRSMLTCDSSVMLKPTEVVGPNLINAKFASIGASLSVQVLEKLRKYLTVVKRLEFDVSDEVQKAVENDFVSLRQASGHEAMTAEDLNSLLVLSRLLSLSYGSSTLSKEIWERAKQMEKERKERIAHLPRRLQNPLGQPINLPQRQ